MFPVARLVPDDLDALAVFPVLAPVAVPIERFTSAVAPARALAEFSPSTPDPAPFAPATREEVAVPALRLARVAGSTLPNVPFAFL